MAEMRAALPGVRPIAARHVVTSRIRHARRSGAGQNVVLVLRLLRGVTVAAGNLVAVLVERGLVIEIIAVPLVVAMKISNIGRDLRAAGVVPRTRTDAVASVTAFRPCVLK